MKSKWKVTYNPMIPENPYRVFRIRDIDCSDHSGNREYAEGFYKTKEEAKIIAEKKNNK